MNNFTKQIISCLNEREKKIYCLRLEGKTLREIGKKFKVSGTRIRQIECRILRKLEERDNPSPFSGVNVRVKNSLLAAGIFSLSQAKNKSDYELLCIKNIGKKTLMEIRQNNIR